MRGVGFEPTNPYGMRFPSWIISSERHVRIDLTPLTKLGNPRTSSQLFDLFMQSKAHNERIQFDFFSFLILTLLPRDEGIIFIFAFLNDLMSSLP